MSVLAGVGRHSGGYDGGRGVWWTDAGFIVQHGRSGDSPSTLSGGGMELGPRCTGMAPRRRTISTTPCLLQRAHKADFGDGASLVQALAASWMIIMSLPPGGYTTSPASIRFGFEIRVASFRFAIH